MEKGTPVRVPLDIISGNSLIAKFLLCLFDNKFRLIDAVNFEVEYQTDTYLLDILYKLVHVYGQVNILLLSDDICPQGNF